MSDYWKLLLVVAGVEVMGIIAYGFRLSALLSSAGLFLIMTNRWGTWKNYLGLILLLPLAFALLLPH